MGDHFALPNICHWRSIGSQFVNISCRTENVLDRRWPSRNDDVNTHLGNQLCSHDLDPEYLVEFAFHYRIIHELSTDTCNTAYWRNLQLIVVCRMALGMIRFFIMIVKISIYVAITITLGSHNWIFVELSILEATTWMPFEYSIQPKWQPDFTSHLEAFDLYFPILLINSDPL